MAHVLFDVNGTLLDPRGSFDGCYDVYRGPTNTSKK